MEAYFSLKSFIAVIVYSIMGLIILCVGFKIVDRVTPGDLWQEIVEKQNVALAIATGSITLAIAQIIAAAIHG